MSLTAGRVEIFFAGHWGSICSDKFTLSDAMGLCHILTRSSSVLAYGSTGSDNLELVKFNKLSCTLINSILNRSDSNRVQTLLLCGFKTCTVCITQLIEGITVTGMVLESPIAHTTRILLCHVELVSHRYYMGWAKLEEISKVGWR